MMKVLVIAVSLMALVGCSSAPALLGPPPRAGYRVIGEAEGGGCGLLFFGILPLGVNGRTERAYREALAKSGGAQLVDTKIQYRWDIIPYAGMLVCTVVEGTAIQ